MRNKQVLRELSELLSWWRVQRWFLPSVAGLVLLPILACCGGGLLLVIVSLLGKSHPTWEDYSAATDEQRVKWARDFRPLAAARNMSWEEYQDYSAALLNWLEYQAVPAIVEAARAGDVPQADEYKETFLQLDKWLTDMMSEVGRPRYGDSSIPSTVNFRNWLPPQKLAKDRAAVQHAFHIAGMAQAFGAGRDPNVRRMLINQEMVPSVRRFELRVNDARRFEEQSKRQWGIE